jgi:hypothetical protein
VTPADFRIEASAVFLLGCGVLAANAFLYGPNRIIN